MPPKEYLTRDQAKYITEKYQECMGSLDSLKSVVESVKESQVDLKTQISTLSESLSSHSVNSSKNINESSSKIISQEDKINKLSDKLDKLSTSIENTSKFVYDLQSSHQETRSSLGVTQGDLLSHKSKSVSLEMMSTFKRSLDENLVVLNDKSKVHEKKFSDHHDMINNMKSKIDSFESYVSSNDLKIENLKNSLTQCHSNVESSSSQIKDYLVLLETKLKDYSDKNIPDISNLASKDDIAKSSQEMSKQIESISLDANNALLRSQNCQTQTDMINKKIEQIKLLLNKYGLGNQ
jgi:chromosome segregation ATPase